ncbi:hypothetical protein L226DRAFT_127795 [Lentinus tigrinus ALCF2SS1-7]|uniref:Uncharacterized protein n=1 Tax=Lentinus tigrinus ALCF2SS1-6 TaxID=1328759 RepID=A0A5C2STX2_9APHY|nr:hypothetical protein L227DRAFT_13926 [Lentinus tigrinus ALCF2SS1-6]RPD81043.1 hypothetical protein L226DRAFT_127795 [Lentinus tigrinus ALCF2SS1-7]
MVRSTSRPQYSNSPDDALACSSAWCVECFQVGGSLYTTCLFMQPTVGYAGMFFARKVPSTPRPPGSGAFAVYFEESPLGLAHLTNQNYRPTMHPCTCCMHIALVRREIVQPYS